MGINLKQLYGMTESSSACVYQPDGEANSETVGRPLASTEIRISDSGEIQLRGPQMFHGYYKNDEATGETIDEDGWLATGDAGFVDDRGHLRVIDRAKGREPSQRRHHVRAPVPREQAQVLPVHQGSGDPREGP